jgi:HEPN domain-containing protein
MDNARNEVLIHLLTDIRDRAEHECEVAKRAGEKQGNYRVIASTARQALKLLAKG